MNLHIVILAAGRGTRMRSAMPKVLHPLAGRPLLGHVLDTAQRLGASQVHLVYGHGGNQVKDVFSSDQSLDWVEQTEQLGTGHAVAQATPNIPDDAVVLILYGDVPLIAPATLQPLIDSAAQGQLALLTAYLDDPSGYGRIIRNDKGAVAGIIEQKDAAPEQLAINEINTGFLAAPAAELKRWIGNLNNDNAQGEYYLTDIIAMAAEDNVTICAMQPRALEETLGVNNRSQLAALERVYQRWQAEQLMDQGVTLIDPARFDMRGTLTAGRDVSIDVNVILEGQVELGNNVTIGANCYLKNVTLAEGVTVLPNSVLEDSEVGAHSRIGPFARLRPETQLAAHTHVGNFVEIKKSLVGEGSKVNHLSYIGDSEIGARVNIGAGTITCNYDGANKHKTVIGDDAFIGSDTQLVAPVKVGRGATIGAGTTLTRDAPDNELTLSRTKQQTRQGWKRPVKQKK